MPTKVIIACPECGKVAQCNHIWPIDIPKTVACDICGADAEVLEKRLVHGVEPTVVLEPAFTMTPVTPIKKEKKRHGA